jgi:hypothetical protein
MVQMNDNIVGLTPQYWCIHHVSWINVDALMTVNWQKILKEDIADVLIEDYAESQIKQSKKLKSKTLV